MGDAVGAPAPCAVQVLKSVHLQGFSSSVHSQIVDMLIKRGADVNARDGANHRPLFWSYELDNSPTHRFRVSVHNHLLDCVRIRACRTRVARKGSVWSIAFASAKKAHPNA